jgi:hypothetical protein
MTRLKKGAVLITVMCVIWFMTPAMRAAPRQLAADICTAVRLIS